MTTSVSPSGAEDSGADTTKKPKKIAVTHHDEHGNEAVPEENVSENSAEETPVAVEVPVDQPEQPVEQTPAEQKEIPAASAPVKIAITHDESETIEAAGPPSQPQPDEQPILADEPLPEHEPTAAQAEKTPSTDDTIELHEESTDADQEIWNEQLDRSKTIEQLDTQLYAKETIVGATPPKPQPAEQPQPVKQDDAVLETAVDAIVRAESDAVLQAEDTKRHHKEDEEPTVTGWRRVARAVRTPFSWWWQRKVIRYTTIFALFAGVVSMGLIPTTRYSILNTVGVRVQSSLSIVDAESGRPIKGILISLQGQEQRTDENGAVFFDELRLGNSQLLIDKRGYERLDRTQVLGWGSNPLGELDLRVTGTQFSFILKNWLGESIITEAEMTSGEDIGQADEEGRVVLTVGDYTDASTADIVAPGYRALTVELTTINERDTELRLVPSKKHPFVSNRSGQYDLYAIDVDGQNEEVVLPATGREREIPFVLPHPTQDVAAYVSSRDGDVNRDNFVLDGLFSVDLITGEAYKVVRSEQIQVIGWHDRKLVYVAVVEGASAGNSERSTLMSFDLDSKERTELASGNYFNDVKLVGDTVYYALSSFAVPESRAKLSSVLVDGSEKQVLLDKEAWTIARVDINTLLFYTADRVWQRFDTNTTAVEELTSVPAIRDHRHYATAPNSEQAVRTEVRDGKGVLLRTDVAPDTAELAVPLLTLPGLADPVYWLDDQHVVFHVNTSTESTDYVLHVASEEYRKIADVVGNRSRYFY